MSDHEHQDGQFKVTDRRKFTMEGELRDSATTEPEPAPPKPEAAAAPPPTPQPAATPAPPVEPADDGDPGFERIIMSFAQTAMMQLGLVGLDPTQPLEPDMMGARETIDMLAVLEKKTRGNLNAREKRLITETLHQLQLAYVGVQRDMLKPRPGPK